MPGMGAVFLPCGKPGKASSSAFHNTFMPAKSLFPHAGKTNAVEDQGAGRTDLSLLARPGSSVERRGCFLPLLYVPLSFLDVFVGVGLFCLFMCLRSLLLFVCDVVSCLFPCFVGGFWFCFPEGNCEHIS